MSESERIELLENRVARMCLVAVYYLHNYLQQASAGRAKHGFHTRHEEEICYCNAEGYLKILGKELEEFRSAVLENRGSLWATGASNSTGA